MSMPPRIETERLLLLRLRYEDAEEIFYTYASKPEATRYMAWQTHRTVDDTRAFLRYCVEAWSQGTDFTYGIRLQDGTLIGSIGIMHDDGKVQFGYVISPNHWGKGYATEACVRVLSILKTIPDLYRIGTFVDADNAASIKVLAKCGLVEEARVCKWFRFVNQDNEPKDCVLFRLTLDQEISRGCQFSAG